MPINIGHEPSQGTNEQMRSSLVRVLTPIVSSIGNVNKKTYTDELRR
jgi:hypothetical protein